MSQTCPECHKPLAQFSVTCDNCGWDLVESARSGSRANRGAASNGTASNGAVVNGVAHDELLTGFDLHYSAASESIERGDFKGAQMRINRALQEATNQQACEATALRGYAFLKAKEFKEAEAACSESIKTGWSESRVYAWRAAARAEQKRYHDAMDDIQIAIAQANGDEGPYLAMAKAFVGKAKSLYGQLLAANPSDNDALWQRGWVYMQANMEDKAARDFKNCLKQDATQGWAWIGLGRIAGGAGDFDQAIKLTTKALVSADASIQRAAYFDRARAWARLDGAEACHEDLEQVERLAEESIDQRLQLAQSRLDLRLYSSCISDCDSLLRQAPGYMPATLLRGVALSRLGQHRAALKDLSAFVHSFPEHANALTERARVLTDLDETDRALADLSIAIRVCPTSVAVNLERARTFLARKQFESAIVSVERALALAPNNAEAHQVAGRIRYAENDYQSAVDEFTRAIDLAASLEDKAENLFLRGTTLYEVGQFELAGGDFESASSLRTSHAGTWIWAAAVAARLENWSQAIQSLQRAIACRPGSARQYMQLGRPVAEKAVAFFTKQIERGHEDVQTVRSRGLAHQFLGHAKQAIADFNVALEVVPDDLETRVRRGQQFQKSGDHHAAVDDFSYVVHRDKVHHLVRFYRALSLFALDRIPQASSDILKAIELDPRQARYHVLRGEIVMREGRTTRAIRCFDRAIALDPQNSAARRLKANALVELNEPNLALTEFSRAIELNPDSAEAHFGKGQLLLKSGRFEEASRDFEKGIMKNPKSLRSYLGKASALIGMGDFRETVLWLTKSLHQFKVGPDLAEILMKRGRAFFKMGLAAYAINDFTACKKMLKEANPDLAATARFARALAFIQKADYESAKRDLAILSKSHSEKFLTIPELNEWLASRNGAPPAEVFLPDRMQKMPKPKVVRPAKKLKHTGEEWKAEHPFDTWVLRVDNEEFGPVPKNTLDRWVEQGRVTAGMKIVRGDWPRWKHAEKIYRDLLENHS